MSTFSEIRSRRDLSNYIGVKYSTLNYILYHMPAEDKYRVFTIPKKNGEIRIIHAPTPNLKRIQKKLADALVTYQAQVDKADGRRNKVIHGFVKGKSFITNAEVHRNHRYIINADIIDFFDSFNYGRVYGFFVKNKDYQLSSEASAAIAGICCHEGKLPQGAPTSPIIANLISRTMDMHILKIAKKYRLKYTRYADDLTFSTNHLGFSEVYEAFIDELAQEMVDSGFQLNTNKTRIQFSCSRQEVTGLVVNRKVNVRRDYYKKTRAMANSLYRNGEFFIDKENGRSDLSQLEGRFSYINQLVWHNNRKWEDEERRELNAREKDYRLFLFYKYFYANDKPTVVTEGKTDSVYIRCALKEMHDRFPNLVYVDKEGQVHYKIRFLRRTKRLKYFLNIQEYGADSLSVIAYHYDQRKGKNNKSLYDTLQDLSGVEPLNPVILLFDNELKQPGKKESKPLHKFVSKYFDSDNESIKKIGNGLAVHMKGNLSVMAIPCPEGLNECEIEDLFSPEALSTTIDGKTFNRKEKGFDASKHYSKDRFSKYVMANSRNIDFSGFIPLLSRLNEACKSQST